VQSSAVDNSCRPGMDARAQLAVKPPPCMCRIAVR
jgi:hypothetical protein